MNKKSLAFYAGYFLWLVFVACAAAICIAGAVAITQRVFGFGVGGC